VLISIWFKFNLDASTNLGELQNILANLTDYLDDIKSDVTEHNKLPYTVAVAVELLSSLLILSEFIPTLLL